MFLYRFGICRGIIKIRIGGKGDFVRTIKPALLQKNDMESSIYKKRLVERRKSNGLCIRCGNPLDRDGIRCISCSKKTSETEKQRRHWYQDNGICPRCGKVSLMGDEKNCPECRAEIANRMAKRREGNREEYNEKQKIMHRNIHEKRMEQGICTRCGKRKADGGYKTCGICRSKDREYRRAKYGKPERTDRFKQGLCFFCDEPVKDGYKVCEKHYQMNLEKSHSRKCMEYRKEFKKIENRIIKARKVV